MAATNSVFIATMASSDGTSYGLNVQYGFNNPDQPIISYPWQGGADNELWVINQDGTIVSAMVDPNGNPLYLAPAASGDGLIVSSTEYNWTVGLNGSVGTIVAQDGTVATVDVSQLNGGLVTLAALQEGPPVSQTWRTVTSFTPTPTQVLCSADMIEDYNNAMLPPCAPTAQAFCAITNANGQTELLTISDDGQLLWIYPDSTASSGWSHITTPFIGCTSTPGWLTGFYTFNESGGPPLIMVFYGPNILNNDPDPAYGMQYDGTAWTAVQLSSDAANLLQLIQGQPLMSISVDIGETVPRVLVYGVAYDYSDNVGILVRPKTSVYFLGLGPNTNIWSVYSTFEDYSNSHSAQAGWLPGAGMTVWNSSIPPDTDGSDATQYWFSATIDWSNASISWADYGGGNVPGYTIPLWTTPVPCAKGFNSFIYADYFTNAITQWSVTVGNSSSTTATPLQGGSGQPQAGITLGAGLVNGLLVAFVLEQGTNLLWMLQQTDADGIGHFTWAPLGDYGTAIAVPRTMSVPQVIIYDDTGNISLLSQNADSSWFKNVMATPTPPSQSPVSATTYTFEFTAADANGNPVPNTVLSIEPDTPQTLVVNQIAYQATPGSPVLCVADAFGRVTVAALAGALASPELTVEICGIQGNSNGAPPVSAGTFRADYLLHNRMAGNDPQFPVDQQAYTSAGLLPSNIDPDTATSFCNNMQVLSQGAVNMANGINSSAAMATRPSPRAFVFDFSTRGTMICRDLTAVELAAHRARRPAPDSVFSGLWGDIAHFFKHAWQQVEKVVVDIENGISVAINDGEKFFMKVIDDIRDAIEVILQALNNLVKDVVDFVKKAIEWLKAIFDWQDIINTKDVLKWFFLQNANNLQQLLATSSLQTWINSLFTKLNTDITSAFGQLESVFGGNTFNGMAPASSNNPMLSGGPPLQAAPLQQQWQTNSMKINYVTSKVGDLSVGTNGSVGAMVSAFEGAFTSDEIQNSLAGLVEQIKSIQSLSDFLDTAICTLLTACQDIVLLVLDAIQAVINAIFTAATAALQTALQLFENEIDIPIISYLYQKIAGSALSILDLLCLIIAVPCTILYKIFLGGSDATAPFTSDQVQTLCPSSFTWPWFASSNPSIQMPEPTAALDSGALTEALTILSTLGIIVGFLTFVTDAAGDVLNLASDGGEPPSKFATKLIGWSNAATTFIQTCIYLPWQGGQGDISTTDWLDLAGSLFPLIPWLADVITLTAQAYQAKFIPDGVGPAIPGVLGAVQLGIGIATVVEMKKDGGYNGCDEAAAILNCCSPLCKFGTYAKKAGDEAAVVAGVVMGLLDLAGDLVVPILSALSATEGSS
jgi:hypothetical protein